MATRTVAESREERKRELESAKQALQAAVSKYAAAELAASDASDCGMEAALLDERVRCGVGEAARHGLEAAYRADRPDVGVANAPACDRCGTRMRYVGREVSPVETALGRVKVALGRYACGACGTSVRPRERALDIEGSITPTARRLASLAGSSCCYAEADRLLVELAGVNTARSESSGRRGRWGRIWRRGARRRCRDRPRCLAAALRAPRPARRRLARR